MSEFLLKERLLPLDDSWDVIVAGGGPAGCAAAIAAARVEQRPCSSRQQAPIRMGTGLVPTFCPFSDKEKIIYQLLRKSPYSL